MSNINFFINQFFHQGAAKRAAVRQDVISSGRRRKHPSILSPLSSPSDEEVAADIPPYLTFRLSALSSDCQLQFPLRRCKVGLFTSCGPFIVASIIIHPIQMPVSRSWENEKDFLRFVVRDFSRLTGVIRPESEFQGKYSKYPRHWINYDENIQFYWWDFFRADNCALPEI